LTAAITEESITSAFAEVSTKLAVDVSRFAFQVDAPSACENALKVTAKAEPGPGPKRSAGHSTDRAHSRARDVLQLAPPNSYAGLFGLGVLLVLRTADSAPRRWRTCAKPHAGGGRRRPAP
jgi:hypothetical protein